jgi:hypothetical protein
MQHVIKQHGDEFTLDLGDGVTLIWSRKVHSGQSHFAVSLEVPELTCFKSGPELNDFSLTVPSRH